MQSLLRTVPFVGTAAPRRRASHREGRGPLRQGAYPELEVRAPELGWRGIVDLLVIDDRSCEIRDFKTGAPTDEHEFQIRVYAALWSADRELNPSGSLATKLTISYPGGDVVVPAPSPEEIATLKEELIRRAAAARALAGMRPPEARPSLDTCRYCDVRHLCSVYWEASTQRQLAAESDMTVTLHDLEIRVVERRGPVTWDAVAQRSGRLRTDEPLVLYGDGGRYSFEEGAVMRILDARLLTAGPDESDDSPDLPIVRLASTSEVYALT